MDLDAGVIVVLVLMIGFLAIVVWAEVYTRRRRRRPKSENGGDGALSRTAVEPDRRTARKD